jgi:cytochrome c-type biogenesis protein CcmH
MRALLALFLLLLPVAGAIGSEALPKSMANSQLSDPVAEARAAALMGQLRCIQCQGQSIHDSDAPIAAAMRHEVRSRITKGDSDQEIRGGLIKRYGEWIDFSPPTHGMGLLLWLLPLLLVGFGLWVARSRFVKGE